MRYLSIILFFLLFTGCKKETESIQSKKLKTSENEIFNYVEYCNDRYDFCFEYPSNFGAKPGSTNGDGKVFVNKPDSAMITMYGFIDESGNDLENQLGYLNEMIDEKKINKITNGYEIHGTLKENGHLYYELIKFKFNKDSLKTIGGLQFTYPKNKKNKYKGYWEKMIQKFE